MRRTLVFAKLVAHILSESCQYSHESQDFKIEFKGAEFTLKIDSEAVTAITTTVPNVHTTPVTTEIPTTTVTSAVDNDEVKLASIKAAVVEKLSAWNNKSNRPCKSFKERNQDDSTVSQWVVCPFGGLGEVTENKNTEPVVYTSENGYWKLSTDSEEAVYCMSHTHDSNNQCTDGKKLEITFVCQTSTRDAVKEVTRSDDECTIDMEIATSAACYDEAETATTTTVAEVQTTQTTTAVPTTTTGLETEGTLESWTSIRAAIVQKVSAWSNRSNLPCKSFKENGDASSQWIICPFETPEGGGKVTDNKPTTPVVYTKENAYWKENESILPLSYLGKNELIYYMTATGHDECGADGKKLEISFVCHRNLEFLGLWYIPSTDCSGKYCGTRDVVREVTRSDDECTISMEILTSAACWVCYSVFESVRQNDMHCVISLMAGGFDLHEIYQNDGTYQINNVLSLVIKNELEHDEEKMLEMLEFLIEQGADVNEKLSHTSLVDGWMLHTLTPLHLAAWRGQTKSVRILLNHGADVNVVAWTYQHFSNLGYTITSPRTPIYFAASQNHAEIAWMLYEEGARLTNRDVIELKEQGAAINYEDMM